AGVAVFCAVRLAASAMEEGSGREMVSDGNASKALGLAALVSAVFGEADLPPNIRTNPLYHRSSGTGAWPFSSAVSWPSIRVSRAARGDNCIGSPGALEVPTRIYETSLGNRRLW